jgi:26S proteasome regulatory subunit N5
LRSKPARCVSDCQRYIYIHTHSYKASDLASTSRILVAICTIAKDAGDWSLLNEQVLLLSKKHGQLKQATTKMVQTVMGFLDNTPDLETKLSVIETLRTVTEGKVRDMDI